MCSLCGGLISTSERDKLEMAYGIWACAMSWVMPDKWHAEYVRAIAKSKNIKYGRDRRRAEKEYADFIFRKYARSQI